MVDPILIRLAAQADCESLYDVHRRSFCGGCSTHYTKEQLDACFGSKTVEGYLPGIEAGVYHVAVLEGTVVGFGHAEPGEIMGLFIAPEKMRRGYGAQMLRHLLPIAESGNTDRVTLEATLNAVGFYRAHGFKKVGDGQRKCRNTVVFPLANMERTKAEDSDRG